ncbi:hypothetical protein [Paraburkholderia guartelaensis]|uniref:hypothetical protein n=1 Tax=Paraburkholderia guartelaensis TaxID=2546446 RepID=UPI002AB728CA|nr:hypothetical protein [Paraburkholderia guartelaensis]
MEKTDYTAMLRQLELANEELKKLVCRHPQFATLLRTILDGISGRSRDLLIVVNGAARAGKTTLSEAIAGIVDELAHRAGQRRGCVRLPVPSPDKLGRFNWRVALTHALVSDEQVPPFNAIANGDIAGTGRRHISAALSAAKGEEAQWDSFVKIVRQERLVTFVDEGNTIPVTLSDLQMTRAIHSLKDIVAQTHQPLLIFGTFAVRQIVEHDTLKVRTTVLMFDAYTELDEAGEAFIAFIKAAGRTYE